MNKTWGWDKMVECLKLSALILLCNMDVCAQTMNITVPPDVELVRDVDVGSGGGRMLKLNIVRPKGLSKDPMPVLVFIYGGGWNSGNRNTCVPRMAQAARRGYFCAGIEHRPSNEAIFPAQIEDCKCAVRFLRAKAREFNINPDSIGVWGGSSGGHLALLLGTTSDKSEFEGNGGWQKFSSRVQAVCAWCAPTDLTQSNPNMLTNLLKNLLGGAYREKSEAYIQASPVSHVSKDDAPTLLIHGKNDTVVQISHSQSMFDRLKKAGVDAKLISVSNAGHNFEQGSRNMTPSIDTLNEAMYKFYDKHLKKGRRQ